MSRVAPSLNNIIYKRRGGASSRLARGRSVVERSGTGFLKFILSLWRGSRSAWNGSERDPPELLGFAPFHVCHDAIICLLNSFSVHPRCHGSLVTIPFTCSTTWILLCRQLYFCPILFARPPFLPCILRDVVLKWN